MAYTRRGEAFTKRKDFEKALRDLNRATALAPDNAAVLFSRGKMWYLQGQIDRALQDLDRSIQISPSASTYLYRGLTLTRKGALDRAIADFDEVTRRQPNRWVAYECRALAWVQKGNDDRAIADLTKTIQLHPHQNHYHYRGHAWLRKGQSAEALADFDEAIRLEPRAESYYGRSAAYKATGNYAAAIADLESALELADQNVAVLCRLALLLAACPVAEHCDGPRAVELATKACEIGKWSSPGPLDFLAASWAAAGDFQKAIQFQQRAIDMVDEPSRRTRYTERLQLYRQGKPYRFPE